MPRPGRKHERIVGFLAALSLGLSCGLRSRNRAIPISRSAFSSASPQALRPTSPRGCSATSGIETWAKGVAVENVTGAGGNLAVAQTAKSAPDGYTLAMGGNAALVINPNLMDKLGYDPIKDFTYITQVFIVPNLWWCGRRSREGHQGTGRARQGQAGLFRGRPRRRRHLAASRRRAVHVDDRVKIQQVPYRGTTQVLPDLLGGRLNIFFGNISNVLPLVREGKLRAFAVTSRKRSPQIPELPTMEELGFPVSTPPPGSG